MKDKFERIVTITPAFDKRHEDPKKNYGIGSASMRMVLKGKLGATQFILYTGWHLPHIQTELKPLPVDLGYHSPKPLFEGQSKMDNCDVLKCGHCYYDGSGLNAKRIYDVLLREGSDGVWRELEEYYRYLFQSGEQIQ
jgi:hypothetical protein